jgi:hypothetical protein
MMLTKTHINMKDSSTQDSEHREGGGPQPKVDVNGTQTKRFTEHTSVTLVHLHNGGYYIALME